LKRRVWSSERENFYVVDVEWAGDDLLLSVLPGVRHSEDVGPEDYKSWQVLVVNPKTKRLRQFTNVPAQSILSNEVGDKVLLGRLDWFGDRGELWFGVFRYPDGKQMGSVRFTDPVKQLGGYTLNSVRSRRLLGWADDKEHIWVIGEREGPRITPGVGKESVPVLISVDMKGNAIVETGDPKRCWVLWSSLDYTNIVMPGKTNGLEAHRMRAQMLKDGRLALTVAPGPRISIFSMRCVRKEYYIEPRRYPTELRDLLKNGWRTRVLAITLDGENLVLQGKDGWVWTWNLESNRMRRLVKAPYIEAAFGWLGGEYLMVTGGYGTHIYGVIYVPEK
jgi:hypothetical protein